MDDTVGYHCQCPSGTTGQHCQVNHLNNLDTFTMFNGISEVYRVSCNF